MLPSFVSIGKGGRQDGFFWLRNKKLFEIAQAKRLQREKESRINYYKKNL